MHPNTPPQYCACLPIARCGQSAYSDALHQMFLAPAVLARLAGGEVFGFTLWVSLPFPLAALRARGFSARRSPAPARPRGVRGGVSAPPDAPLAKVEAARGQGATIHVGGESVDECLKAALARAEEGGLAFVHPFDDPLVIAGRTFGSRLLLGTGGFRSLEEMGAAIRASGTELVTVALRRVNPAQRGSIMDVLADAQASRARTAAVTLTTSVAAGFREAASVILDRFHGATGSPTDAVITSCPEATTGRSLDRGCFSQPRTSRSAARAAPSAAPRPASRS